MPWAGHLGVLNAVFEPVFSGLHRRPAPKGPSCRASKSPFLAGEAVGAGRAPTPEGEAGQLVAAPGPAPVLTPRASLIHPHDGTDLAGLVHEHTTQPAA